MEHEVLLFEYCNLMDEKKKTKNQFPGVFVIMLLIKTNVYWLQGYVLFVYFPFLTKCFLVLKTKKVTQNEFK